MMAAVQKLKAAWKDDASTAIAALQTLKAASKDDDSFYDREKELNELLSLVEVGVQRIVVVIGPNNSGKSAILKRMDALFHKDPVLKARFPLFRIDMRRSDYHAPQLAAAAISKQLRSWSSWCRNVAASITLAGVSLAEVAKLLEEDSIPEGDLAAVMAAFQRLAYGASEGVGDIFRPIFIVDEAHRLKKWAPDDTEILMGGFVAMTKQDRKAIVILSSSDDFFREWFENHVNAPQWVPIGVGYFKEEDAKCFFSRLLSSYAGTQVVGDAEWEKIFKVCGGNPLELENTAVDVYKMGKQLDVVLEGKVGAMMALVDLGLSATKDRDGYEGSKFKAVMDLIVKYHAVGITRVCTRVFEKDRAECTLQLRAMLKKNVIHVRYVPADLSYDDMSRNPSSSDADYVMARSSAHEIAMESFSKQLDSDD